MAVTLLSQIPALAQEPVAIRVNTTHKMAPFNPIYAYFGYDEPNYTYTSNGSKLVGELAALTDAPVYIRTHFLLATGDHSWSKMGFYECLHRRCFRKAGI
jgi:xylan 1,4-beta-xylosidase